MDYLSWFLTPTAVLIAWICTVLGFLLGIYGLVQKNEKNKLKVQKGSIPSTNIHAFIGRNGCGKTTILNGMIDAIVNPSNEECFFTEIELFNESRIPNGYFRSLISVSFSAFDPFTPPKEQPDPAKGTRYFYIGLKKETIVRN
jgi:energy-coupling factor transporter ATP-binding protein EcfA2